MAEYVYKVREGDTVLSVCLAFDLSREEFVKLNPDFDILGHRYGMSELRKGEMLVVGFRHNIFHKLRIEEKRKQR